MQSLKILPPWSGRDPLTAHNLWLLNLEPCTLHSSPPAPPTPCTQFVGGGKDYQRKLQRVRTSTSTIGVPDAGSNCYLHKGSSRWYFLYIDIKWATENIVQELTIIFAISTLLWHKLAYAILPDPSAGGSSTLD